MGLTGRRFLQHRGAIFLGCAIFLWLVGVATGGWFIWQYTHSAGPAAKTGLRWPAESKLIRSITSPTLLMFVHPKCPCTNASLVELARIYARCVKKPKVIVAFYSPKDLGRGWAVNGKWNLAARIPHANLVLDTDGVEMHRHGARTSGQSFVYSADGTLVFQGGITGSRGHEGDNTGMSRAISAIEGSGRSGNSTVFGCLLEKN